MDSFIADDGERLYVRVKGSGAPLILLHGWTASHAAWNPVLDALQQQHRVFCPDARGHGGHALSATQAPDVERLARDIRNLLDYYGLERAAFVGHSMGALTLWQFIQDFSCDQITHLCLIDQSPKLVTDETWTFGIYTDFDEQRSRCLIDQLSEEFAESVMRLTAQGLNEKALDTYTRNSRGWQQMRDSLKKLDPIPLIAIWKSLVKADYRPVLPRITVPVLLAWGAASNFYSLATGQYLVDKIPKARLSSYADADHCPQLYQPERFAQELNQFLASS